MSFTGRRAVIQPQDKEGSMTKILMAGLAALLLSTVAVSAGSTAGTTWIKLDNSCDTFGITRNGDVFAEEHRCGDLTLGFGAGMAAKTHEMGTTVILGDSHKTDQITQACYVLQRPFVTGGHWEAYFTSDGKTMNELGSGTYTVMQGPPPGR
jgi:hypothetical protein